MKFKKGDLVKLKPSASTSDYLSEFYKCTAKVIVVKRYCIGVKFLGTNLGHNLGGRLGLNGRGGWWSAPTDFILTNQPAQDKEYAELFI